MSTEVFFCDTYALIEIIGGNENYKKYTRQVLMTSQLNLMELYYAFLRDYDKQTAEKYFNLLSDLIIPVPVEIIKLAMDFKLQHKKENLSYVDCIGYCLAYDMGIKFLTGDKGFGDKDNVEFVK